MPAVVSALRAQQSLPPKMSIDSYKRAVQPDRASRCAQPRSVAPVSVLSFLFFTARKRDKMWYVSFLRRAKVP